jgi:hypothetical protein
LLFLEPFSGLRVSAVGGNANNGLNAGPEYLNANNASSTVNANYGSPLNFFWREFVSFSLKNETEPHPMVKKTHQT